MGKVGAGFKGTGASKHTILPTLAVAIGRFYVSRRGSSHREDACMLLCLKLSHIYTASFL